MQHVVRADYDRINGSDRGAKVIYLTVACKTQIESFAIFKYNIELDNVRQPLNWNSHVHSRLTDRAVSS
jgi:hypothetical protein